MSLTTKLMSIFDAFILKNTSRHENLVEDRKREEIPKNKEPSSHQPPQKKGIINIYSNRKVHDTIPTHWSIWILMDSLLTYHLVNHVVSAPSIFLTSR